MNNLKIAKTKFNIIENSNYPIFCTFFTIDNGYEEYFLKLEKSLNKFNLPYYALGLLIEENSWIDIVQKKPDFILMVMELYPDKDVVWVDSDSIIEQSPNIFLSPLNDVGVYFLNDTKLCSGTLFFKNSEISKIILNEWIVETNKINEKNKIEKVFEGLLWDQKILELLIKKKYMENIFFLPDEYICIFDHPKFKNLEWVISHWQASRRLKNKKGKIIT